MQKKKRENRNALHKKANTQNKPKRNVNWRRLTISLVVLCFVINFVYIMITQQIVLSRKGNEIAELEEKIKVATQKTESLEKELENLNDPEYLEKIARERLGMVRPNERVFVDVNKSQSNQSD